MTSAREGAPFSARVAAAMYAEDRAAQALGIRIEEVAPQQARVTMTVREDMLNSHGICHGGILFALADTAFAYACNSENESTLALSCSISFASAARLGEVLTAVGTATVRQGRTGVYDVRVSADDGRTVAVFRGQSYRITGETVPGLGPAAGGRGTR